MKVIYEDKKTERLCSDFSHAQKKLGHDVAKRLHALMNAIESFANLYDLFVMPQYRLHALKGNRQGQYSFVIHRASKWRLIVYPLDEDGNVLSAGSDEKGMLIKSVVVDILEVSEHYD